MQSPFGNNKSFTLGYKTYVLYPNLTKSFLLKDFIEINSALRTPTLGFPARLVTSLMSFTFPCALHTSSSSSLVQENGKPDMNSLCFSSVVLYLNT